MVNQLLRLWHDESGLTTVEYAIAGALVATGMITAFVNLGGAVETSITGMCTTIKNDGSSC
ncbi:Flp family type IVb pilin [uncultured Oceanisphaera sp.]|uniref:Flp family type IVb pilin n=1 Tax=uncultured Oceanisphaera sp. TaxID=353858 RepID=UPI00260AEF09|nr:Flp family type IVb pilin [uncultured Oceanisphaera sp.]